MADDKPTNGKSEYVVAIGILHEGGKMYACGQAISLSPDRAKARLATRTVVTPEEWAKIQADEAKAAKGTKA